MPRHLTAFRRHPHDDVSTFQLPTPRPLPTFNPESNPRSRLCPHRCWFCPGMAVRGPTRATLQSQCHVVVPDAHSLRRYVRAAVQLWSQGEAHYTKGNLALVSVGRGSCPDVRLPPAFVLAGTCVMMLVRVAWTLMGRSAGLSRVARIPPHVINGMTTAVPGTACLQSFNCGAISRRRACAVRMPFGIL